MHKTLAGLALALVVWTGAGCGGSQKSGTSPPPLETAPSPCVGMAKHMADVLRAVAQQQEGGSDTMAKVAPVVQRVVAERCQADAWSDAVITCINGAGDDTMDGCVDQLTDEQEKAVEAQLEKEMAPLMEEGGGPGGGGGAPTGAPPPPPDDPCGGGA